MAQTSPPPEPEKMHTPLTNSDNRQLKRLTKLRNDANRLDTKSGPTTQPSHKQPSDPGPKKEATHTPTQASNILQLTEPPNIEDIPSLCHNAISTIINKANQKLMDKLRKKEDTKYKKNPKRYHANLKTSAGLQPRVKDQPNLTTIRDPETKEITS